MIPHAFASSMDDGCLLIPQVQFDGFACPGGDSTTEEVLVFRPNWTLQKERRRYNRPVILISGDHPLASGSFIFFVKTPVHDLNQSRQMTEHQNFGARADSTFL